MVTVNDILKYYKKSAPLENAEEWDNVGLLVGRGEREVKKVLVCLDITDGVINEAVSEGYDLILSHHPMFFDGQKKINGDSATGRAILTLAENSVSAVCLHTNMDCAEDGVNDALAEKLGLSDIKPFAKLKSEPFYKIIVGVPRTHLDAVINAMTEAGCGTIDNYEGCYFKSEGEYGFRPVEGANPFRGTVGVMEITDDTEVGMIVPPGKLGGAIEAMKKAHPYEVPAYDIIQDLALHESVFIGRTGVLENEMTCDDFAKYVKERLGSGSVRYVSKNGKIKKVAVCGGAGADFIGDAVREKADAYVTSDIKYHTWQQATEKGIMLVDAGHYSTEWPVTERLRRDMEEEFSLNVKVSENNIDTVSYI